MILLDYFYTVILQVDEIEHFKPKALQWASSSDVFCYLDSNNFRDQYSKFDVLLAIGAKDEVIVKANSSFDNLEQFRAKHPGWITGFFTYDLTNEIEDLVSENPDHLLFPDLYFFAPQHLVLIRNETIEIISDNPEEVIDEINAQPIQEKSTN